MHMDSSLRMRSLTSSLWVRLMSCLSQPYDTPFSSLELSAHHLHQKITLHSPEEETFVSYLVVKVSDPKSMSAIVNLKLGGGASLSS